MEPNLPETESNATVSTIIKTVSKEQAEGAWQCETGNKLPWKVGLGQSFALPAGCN